ncbi:hypothetical protein, conserved [Babesia ovata]|uniref:Extracellular matrix-binding ebh n=1 Tax=Babesia ovata TaxID=189622 RepID=A0A2H6KK98_9APIC|nr:uncharacterized protein BOVATA_049030 [Babesia ovata]GBE63410.1 hypothetical protein, conserved [Babesia ovata]
MCHFIFFNFYLTFFSTFFTHLNCLGHYSFNNSAKSHCQSLNDELDLLKNSDNSQNDSKIDELKSQLKDHVAKYHSLSESDRTAQLKDIHSRMVSLAELSGKLGQFIGQSDAVTNAIKNGIDSIIDSDNEFKSLRNSPSPPAQSSAAVSAEPINDVKLSKKIQQFEEKIKLLESKKNGQNPPLSSEDSRLLSSYQSKLDALQKLRSLNDSLNSLSSNNDNNCKNLLDNLCTGLEKFLGYEKGNYTGSGIVYSDLDRLCDGVMSFLHGVLETVKDDDNVTTYDNDKSNDINNVLDNLHNSVGKGREAFGEAVTQVEERTNKVTTELGKYYKEVQGSDLFPLAYQLEAWMRTVESVDWDIRDISDNHSNILDSTLRIQLAHEIAPVKKVVEHLKGVAKNMTDGNKVKHVDDEIAAKENEVTQLITEKCQQLLKALTERFDLIEEKTRKFGTERAEQLGPLLQSVKQLVTDVGHAEKSAQALAQHYDRDILNGLQTISGKAFYQCSAKGNSGLDQIMDDLDRAKESLRWILEDK